MENINSRFGLSLQKYICDKYNLQICDNASKQYNKAYDSSLEMQYEMISNKIFNTLKLVPIKVDTY